MKEMITNVRAGKRPSRPTDSGQSQWLQDPVWDIITSGWHDRPEKRCQLSDLDSTFSLSSQQSGIQWQVNEMDQVSSSTSPPTPRLT